MGEEADRSKDILGHVYDYFLAGIAGAEGKRGGAATEFGIRALCRTGNR